MTSAASSHVTIIIIKNNNDNNNLVNRKRHGGGTFLMDSPIWRQLKRKKVPYVSTRFTPFLS